MSLVPTLTCFRTPCSAWAPSRLCEWHPALMMEGVVYVALEQCLVHSALRGSYQVAHDTP